MAHQGIRDHVGGLMAYVRTTLKPLELESDEFEAEVVRRRAEFEAGIAREREPIEARIAQAIGRCELTEPVEQIAPNVADMLPTLPMQKSG